MQPRHEQSSARQELRLGLRLRRGASVCLYCRDALERERAECNACAASYHVDCLEALATCGNAGCAGLPVEALRWTEPQLPAREEQGLLRSSRYRNDTRSLREFQSAVARIDARLQKAQAEIDRHRCSVCQEWLSGAVAPCGHCGWRAHRSCHEANGSRCACPTTSQLSGERSGVRHCSICKEPRISGETFCGFCGWCARASCHRSIGRCACRRVHLPAGPIVSSLRQSPSLDTLADLGDRFWWLAPLLFWFIYLLLNLAQ